MIDKSIRQYYADGEKVGPFRRGMEMIMPKLKAQALPQEGRTLPNIIRAPLQRAALSKLGLGALNPILGLLSLFGIDPVSWAGRKLTEGGAQQALTSGIAGLGFGSPQEGRELRVLENRRANMLQRKEEGRNYSEKNLDMVTRAIAEAKGLDINNPNEMRNIDKDITQIQIEKSITDPQIIPEEPEIKSPFATVIPKTPEVISPHLGEDKIMPVSPRAIPKTPNVISPHLEGDNIIPTPTTVTRDVGLGDAGIAEQIAAENRAAATRAVAIQAENDRQQREADAAAAAARAAVARAYTPPVRHHTGGGNGGGGGMGRGRDPGGGAAGSPFKKGGRIDKALGGRSRDIG